MKKLLLLSISLCSLSTMAIYSSEYTEKASELEYDLTCVKSRSYQSYHHGAQTFNEIKLNKQSEIAKNKNNKAFLAQNRSTSSVQKTANTKPAIGSAAWALMKNKK